DVLSPVRFSTVGLRAGCFVLGGHSGEVDAGGDVEFGGGVAEGGGGGVRGQEEPLADLAVGQAAGGKLGDPQLGFGQPAPAGFAPLRADAAANTEVAQLSSGPGSVLGRA